jgi:hypothetical protein
MNRNAPWETRRQARRLSTARAVNAHFLGKSTEAFKLTVPAALKQELEVLAAQRGEPLSEYLRRILARQLLGEGHYGRWQAELRRVREEAEPKARR